MKLSIKRVYEDPEDGDGFRILVDRLWPRGGSKEKANLDSWLRDVCGQHETVTLIYSARDSEHNQAVVLQRLLAK